MSEPLALKYRPRRWLEVAGQKPNAAVLYQQAVRGNYAPAYLFSGQRGCGKTTTARILGAAANCEQPPGPPDTWPCWECPSCVAVARGQSPAVTEVDAARHASVENIRRIIDDVNYGTAGERRVVILDEVHALSRDAFDTLLMTLEDPPPLTTFLLLTTAPGRVPDTVRSRCSPFEFRPIPLLVIRERLGQITEAEGLGTEAELLNAIAEQAGGSMRDAIVKLDTVSSVGITSLAMWQELTGEHDFGPPLLAAAADGNHEVMFKVLDDAVAQVGDISWVTTKVVQCLRDLLVLSEGGQVAVQGRALADRQDLASRLGQARIVLAMRVLWELQARVRIEDRAAGLSLAMVMVSEKLCPMPLADVPAASVNGNGHRAANISELTAVLGGAPK